MQAQKLELSAGAVKTWINLHKSIGLPFELTLTNYTTKIKSALYDLHFMKNAQSNKVFVTYAKLKSEVVKKPVEDINMSLLKYFQTNFNFTDLYADKIYNVDIKSAYATILHNDGFISDTTHRYISTLPKVDRLAAVGMLAGKKTTFLFDATGKITGSMETVSPTSNYFYYAVKKTYEVIDTARMELGNDFIFSWVDGIYFKGQEHGEKLRALLFEQYGLLSSFDELTEFEIKRGQRYTELSYIKDEERKVFQLPVPDTTQRNEIFNYLVTLKNRNDASILFEV